MAEKRRKRVLILGAAGRDFHNFNVFFRDNPPDYEVVAFTATQIPPDIEAEPTRPSSRASSTRTGFRYGARTTWKR